MMKGECGMRSAECGTGGNPSPLVTPHSALRVPHLRRDPALRALYLSAALPHIPRLLGAIDRNPFRRTHGCLDRQFWHYRTADFPSEMYQEGVWPLALVHAHPMPGNRWHGDERVRELAVAGLRFTARSGHRDGSCDDYYPHERALGAAVFSLVAAGETYRLLRLDDAELRDWFDRRARWLTTHDESGRLANHQALAALGLALAARVTGRDVYNAAAEDRARRVLAWQADEGWFDEYGGADPGYQTVTIDCLARYRRLTGATWLDEPLRRATAFAGWFLHPDDSYGGEYGSRGTYHFYPHGMELLAGEDDQAADLAEGFLRSLAAGRQAWFDDDRLFAHRLGGLIEAWRDWGGRNAECGMRSADSQVEPEVVTPFRSPLPTPHTPLSTPHSALRTAHSPLRAPRSQWFAHAQLLVRRDGGSHTVISAARGGVFKHFADGRHVATDAGLIVELHDGRVAVSQSHELTRRVECALFNGDMFSLLVEGPLHAARFETATPLKFLVFRLLLLSLGRWCRTLVRGLLQRRLITGRRPCPVELSRRFEFLDDSQAVGTHPAGGLLRVTDTIRLTDNRARVRRMSFGTDHQAAYVAACGVYQDAVLTPWTDLSVHIDGLNRDRCVTIIREFAA
jgi:hypothetical protein